MDHEGICKTGYIDWKNEIERAWVPESTVWTNTPYQSGLPFSELLCETNYPIYATIILKLCFSQLSAQCTEMSQGLETKSVITYKSWTLNQ